METITKRIIAMITFLIVVSFIFLLAHPAKAERTEETKLEKLYRRNEELTKRYHAKSPKQFYYFLIGKKKAMQEAVKKTRELKNEIIKIRREIKEINRTRTFTLKEWLFDNSIAHPAACIQNKAELLLLLIISIILIIFIILLKHSFPY